MKFGEITSTRRSNECKCKFWENFPKIYIYIRCFARWIVILEFTKIINNTSLKIGSNHQNFVEKFKILLTWMEDAAVDSVEEEGVALFFFNLDPMKIKNLWWKLKEIFCGRPKICKKTQKFLETPSNSRAREPSHNLTKFYFFFSKFSSYHNFFFKFF